MSALCFVGVRPSPPLFTPPEALVLLAALTAATPARISRPGWGGVCLPQGPILLLLFPLYERRAGHVAIFHLPPAAPLPTGLASQVASVPCTSCLLAVWSWSRCCSFRGQV